MIIQELYNKKLISPPKWLPDNCHYITIMGSISYGVSNDTSDFDVYGFCIPPREQVFPHLAGHIPGFGNQPEQFEQYQQHHIIDPMGNGGKGREYDFSIYSIVKYFQLAMTNNPNMVDSLFTPRRCVLHCTKIGEMVRENRRLFLHKGAWHKFKGYAYSQVHKMKNKNPEGKRKAIVDQFGYDVKFAYHVVRLLNEIEMILTEHDLDLERNREQLKSIRRGEWSQQDIEDYFSKKEKELEKTYAESKLPYAPDEAKIKNLLLCCLEEHYGNLDKCVVRPDAAKTALREIEALVEKYRSII